MEVSFSRMARADFLLIDISDSCCLTLRLSAFKTYKSEHAVAFPNPPPSTASPLWETVHECMFRGVPLQNTPVKPAIHFILSTTAQLVIVATGQAKNPTAPEPPSSDELRVMMHLSNVTKDDEKCMPAVLMSTKDTTVPSP